MANEKNLIPFTSDQSREEAVKNGQKGGIASGIARREARTVQKILRDFLDLPPENNSAVCDIAAKMGLSGAQSMKEVCTLVYLINSLKDGKLSDLEQLSNLLGEKTEKEEGESADFDLSSVEVMPKVNELPKETDDEDP